MALQAELRTSEVFIVTLLEEDIVHCVLDVPGCIAAGETDGKAHHSGGDARLGGVQGVEWVDEDEAFRLGAGSPNLSTAWLSRTFATLMLREAFPVSNRHDPCPLQLL